MSVWDRISKVLSPDISVHLDYFRLVFNLCEEKYVHLSQAKVGFLAEYVANTRNAELDRY